MSIDNDFVWIRAREIKNLIIDFDWWDLVPSDEDTRNRVWNLGTIKVLLANGQTINEIYYKYEYLKETIEFFFMPVASVWFEKITGSYYYDYDCALQVFIAQLMDAEIPVVVYDSEEWVGFEDFPFNPLF